MPCSGCSFPPDLHRPIGAHKIQPHRPHSRIDPRKARTRGIAGIRVGFPASLQSRSTRHATTSRRPLRDFSRTERPAGRASCLILTGCLSCLEWQWRLLCRVFLGLQFSRCQLRCFCWAQPTHSSAVLVSVRHVRPHRLRKDAPCRAIRHIRLLRRSYEERCSSAATSTIHSTDRTRGGLERPIRTGITPSTTTARTCAYK
jgi:hypothetical protein